MDSLDRLNVLIFWSRIIAALWPRCLKNTDGQWNIYGKVVFQYLLMDLNKMLDLVLPVEDWKALTNLPVSIEILQFLLHLVKTPEVESMLNRTSDLTLLTCPRDELMKSLSEETLHQIEVKKFEFRWLEHTPATRYENSLEQCLKILVDRREKTVIIQEMYRKHLCLNLPSSSQPPTVLHRMENDRERHKKSKEHNWFIDREHMLDTTEFDNLWKTFATGMNRNDYQNIKNIQEIAHTSYIYLEQ